MRFTDLFPYSKPIIGMVHFPALPGSPLYNHKAELDYIIDRVKKVRYSHSPNEVCDLRDLVLLKKLLISSIKNINSKFKLLRN